MTKNEFYYPSADGKTNIHAVSWIPEKEPKAIIQIAHGITEHILRYEEFAEYLADRGFIVVGNDHIGHGTSIAEGAAPMFFGSEGSFRYLIEDMNTCMQKMKEQYEGVPYCMLGFSLGSFLVRAHLFDYPGEADAAILIGTGKIPNAQIAIAKWLANREAMNFGEAETSPMIKKLTFDTYNKNFAPNRTDFDWLCANERAIDDYIADELCGSYYTAGAFREMLNVMAYSNRKRAMYSGVPIFLLSGKNDPVAEGGKSVQRTFRFLMKCVDSVDVKMYPNMRHDILHESDREHVFDDIVQFIEDRVLIEKNPYDFERNHTPLYLTLPNTLE